MAQNHRKITVSLPEDTVQFVDANWREFGFGSRSEYIDAAIKRLGAREMLYGFKDELAEVYSQMEHSELKDFENRMAKIGYKMAVQMAEINVLPASSMGLTYAEMQRIRGKAYHLVRKTHGTISLSTAAKNQVPLEDAPEESGYYN